MEEDELTAKIVATIAKDTLEIDRIDIELRKLTGNLVRKLTMFFGDKGLDENLIDLNSLLMELEGFKKFLIRNMNKIDSIRGDRIERLKEKHQIQFVELDVRATKCMGEINTLLNIIEDYIEVFTETKRITKERKEMIAKIGKKIKNIEMSKF